LEMKLKVLPGKPLRGVCRVPGDKSISHRAALMAAMAEGVTVIKNYQKGADCLSTLRCLRSLGVLIEEADGEIRITGKGLHGFQEPDNVLDAGNSGTTMRLLLGILAAQRFFSVITGDSSLRRRPMGRVVRPLQEMGAEIWGRQGGTKAPLAIKGVPFLKPISYQMPVASAQVKSALLLAGLYAEGTTTVIQPVPTRDHTERMLRSFGVQVDVQGLAVSVRGGGKLSGGEVTVPGDISSAAFLMVAASILPESKILIKDVGVNPTRTGIIEVLREMGAEVVITNERMWGEEPVADIQVSSSALRGVEVKGERIPRLIDEIPVLAVAALSAAGTTEIRDAAELRVKESDRLQVLVTELRKMGASVRELPDGLVIEGGKPLQGAVTHSWGDHRMAMALTIAGLVASAPLIVEDAACIDVSFPGFVDTLRSLGATVDVSE
jgi:3-phosphoshikimate 1-carboxyvinyltransferase